MRESSAGSSRNEEELKGRRTESRAVRLFVSFVRVFLGCVLNGGFSVELHRVGEEVQACKRYTSPFSIFWLNERTSSFVLVASQKFLNSFSFR
jgi:hypothetical protein